MARYTVKPGLEDRNATLVQRLTAFAEFQAEYHRALRMAPVVVSAELVGRFDALPRVAAVE